MNQTFWINAIAPQVSLYIFTDAGLSIAPCSHADAEKDSEKPAWRCRQRCQVIFNVLVGHQQCVQEVQQRRKEHVIQEFRRGSVTPVRNADAVTATESV